MREYPYRCPCGEEIRTFGQGVEHQVHGETDDPLGLRETTGRPAVYWAILVWDEAIREKRITGIYLEGRDANIDALAMEGGDTSVTVEPWLIYTVPRFASEGEPAWELSDGDFDVAIDL